MNIRAKDPKLYHTHIQSPSVPINFQSPNVNRAAALPIEYSLTSSSTFRTNQAPCRGLFCRCVSCLILAPLPTPPSDSPLREGLVDDGNLYEWEIMIIGFASSPCVTEICRPSAHNTLTLDDLPIAAPPILSSTYPFFPVDAFTLILVSSEGGFFKARLTFPPEFPLLPPKMRFITPMWHPNSASLSTLRHLVFTETCISHSISRWARVHLYPCGRHIQSLSECSRTDRPISLNKARTWRRSVRLRGRRRTMDARPQHRVYRSCYHTYSHHCRTDSTDLFTQT